MMMKQFANALVVAVALMVTVASPAVATPAAYVRGAPGCEDVIELKQNAADGKYVIKKLPGRVQTGKVTCESGAPVQDVIELKQNGADGKYVIKKLPRPR